MLTTVHWPIAEYSGGPLVGHCNHDNGRLWRYGPQDVHGYAGGGFLRTGRCLDHCPARSSHRLQFFHVLQPHTGMQSSDMQ